MKDVCVLAVLSAAFASGGTGRDTTTDGYILESPVGSLHHAAPLTGDATAPVALPPLPRLGATGGTSVSGISSGADFAVRCCLANSHNDSISDVHCGQHTVHVRVCLRGHAPCALRGQLHHLTLWPAAHVRVCLLSTRITRHYGCSMCLRGAAWPIASVSCRLLAHVSCISQGGVLLHCLKVGCCCTASSARIPRQFLPRDHAPVPSFLVQMQGLLLHRAQR